MGTALGVAVLCSSLGLAGGGTSATAAPAAPAAPADELAEKRAEAERLARELEEQGTRISVLAERLNQARIEAAGVEQKVRAAEGELAAAEQQLAVVRGRLRDRAVASYVRGEQLPVEQVLVSGTANDVLVWRTYVETVAGREQATVDSLDRAQEARRDQRHRLEAARASAEAALARVETEGRAAERAASARRATLDTVQGEVAVLVEEEGRRLAEEEARRVQAEVATRHAREEAARTEAARRAEEAARRAADDAARTTTTTTVRPSVPRAATTTTTTTRPATATTPPPGGDTPVRPPAPGAAAAVAEAKAQIGKPYEWGADGPDSFDCSGLTQWAWKAGGRTLPHSSVAQYGATVRVAVSQIEPGDLVFYGSPIHHVGIYAGDGQMVEASETGTPVRMRSIYRRDLVGVGRVG